MSLASVPSIPFLQAFRRRLDQAVGPGVRFDQFVETALYDPECGYYRAGKQRVGRSPGTDFFTATTSGRWFGELVAAALVSLLGGRDPGTFTFVEVGAEPGRAVLDSVSHPFARTEVRRLGEPLKLHGPTLVFSNELFDAQPFRRFIRRSDHWVEIGVTLRGDSLEEVELGPCREPWLPDAAADGHRLDAPRASIELLETLVAQPWTGVFVACDYGKSLRELMEATPQGTARAYWNHQQSNDLLARPGEQDLTVHVCWDWLEETLARHGFAAPVVVSQEAFFIRHAARYLEASLAAEGGERSERKRALLQLLHPGHLGQKFQVLSAHRW